MQAEHNSNFKIGDLAYVEFVSGSRGNNVRSGPGTKNSLFCSIPVGHVVEIMGGPQYAEGMTWWQVFAPFGCGEKRNVTGWTSEGTARERWLRVISPLAVVQEGCRAPLGTRLAVGERAYVQDPTGRDLANNVRDTPGLRGALKGEIPVEDTLRVLQGPVCKDDMSWWRVRTEGSRALQGWTSEGKAGEGFYLVPLEVRRDRPEPVSDGHGQPIFQGGIVMEPSKDTAVVFSPDGIVVTVLFSDMIAAHPKGSSKSQSKSVSIKLPVISDSPEVRIEQYLLGYIDSNGGPQGVVTVQQGERRRTRVWPRDSAEEIQGILTATVRAAPILSTALAVEIEPSSTPGDAVLGIDLMEIKLLPLHRTSRSARG